MHWRLGQGLQQATGHLVLSVVLSKLGEETPRSPKLKWNDQVIYHLVIARPALSHRLSHSGFLVCVLPWV